jgi:preprotein translocase subunit SecG
MTFTPILADFVSALLGFALFGISLFLILLILVQRGRGGGLTGALGGPGGQSAFGTKAGDLFTRITSFVALGWIALCAFTMWLIGSHSASVAVDPTPVVSPTPAEAASGVNDMLDLGLEPGAMGGVLTPSTPDAPATNAEITTDADLADPAPETPPATGAPATETPAAPPAETPAAEAPAAPPAESPAPPAETPAVSETPAETPAADAPAETPNP